VPFAVYVLALAVFAQATSEFMLSGLVPDIAHGLHVSIAAAGSLTSAFAVGMIVGAPLMAMLSRRWSRRRALLVFLAVFVLVHILGAVTTSFCVLLASRLVAALANAGFLSLAVATVVGMVAPTRKGARPPSSLAAQPSLSSPGYPPARCSATCGDGVPRSGRWLSSACRLSSRSCARFQPARTVREGARVRFDVS
jgi:Major Facilitator Superfamily